MATGGTGLEGTDHVTDQLLSHVSDHVIPDTRTVFATKVLGLSDTECKNIEEDKTSASGRNLEVRWIVCFS